MNASRERESAPLEFPQRPAKGELVGRMGRLALKELRETLRDRRTIMTLLLMPVLVYPLISILFQKLLITNLRPGDQVIYRIGVESEDDREAVRRLIMLGNKLIKGRDASSDKPDNDKTVLGPGQHRSIAPKPPTVEISLRDHLRTSVAEGNDHLGILVRQPERSGAELRLPVPVDCQLILQEHSGISREAAAFVERRFRAVNEQLLERRLRQLGEQGRVTVIRTTRDTVEPARGTSSFELAAVIPLMLILMTITGAVYPAIDLTAGERERGTLEALIAAPIPRLGLLLAKYVAVLAVALLTAAVNLFAMTITVLSSGLGALLFGESGLSLTVVMQVFGLLILFAAFFSALLLTLTSFARSFKEAQSYLIPLMLISLAPGLLGVVPGLQLTGILAVTPLANIVLLSRDLFEGNTDPVMAGVVIISTLVYALAAILLAARVFGSDAILYGSASSWSDFFRRPTEQHPAPSLWAAWWCLAMMFPAHYLLSSTLAQMMYLTPVSRLQQTSLVAILLFGEFPLAAAVLARLKLRECFQLNRPPMIAWPAALLLGLSLWPFAYEIVLLMYQWNLLALNTEFSKLAEGMLKALQDVPLVWKLVSLVFIPAAVEEFCFRGYLLSALRARMHAWKAILLSGLLFGVFHLIVTDALALERLLPSTLLGVVLAVVCVRSGSIFPGMLLHACHNSVLVLAIEYREKLATLGWGTEDQTHLPASWLLGAVVCAVAGFSLIALTRQHRIQRT